MVDTQTGLTTCSCQCSSVLLSPLTRLPVMSNILASGDSYSVGSQPTYMPVTADGSFFCSSLGAHGSNIRNRSDTWRPLTQSPIYEPTPVALYPYRPSYGGLDLNGRRKNATRESTTTLKAWLHEHLKNPYPSKGEKIMLAIITKMTLTQVSTWFANARRRLKKDNRISGSPIHRSDKERDDEFDDILVSGDEEKNTIVNKEHVLGTTESHRNYSTAPSQLSSPRSYTSKVLDNTHKVQPTRSEPQTYTTQGQVQEDLDIGKRKIWSVIEFLNTSSRSDVGLSGVDFVESKKSNSGDVLPKQWTGVKHGRPSALPDNHTSIHADATQSSIHVNYHDNQSSKRQPASCDLRQCVSTR